MLYLQDGAREAVMETKIKDVALKCKQCWEIFGVKPYVDEEKQG